MHYFTIIIVAHTTFHSLLNVLTNDFPEANIYFHFDRFDHWLVHVVAVFQCAIFFLANPLPVQILIIPFWIDMWSYNCEYTNYMMFKLARVVEAQTHTHTHKCWSKTAITWNCTENKNVEVHVHQRFIAEQLIIWRNFSFSPHTFECRGIRLAFLFCHWPKFDFELFRAQVKKYGNE